MNNRELKINKGIEIVEKAKEFEKRDSYDQAAQKYKEARDFFKKIGQNKLAAQCQVAYIVNMVKYYIGTRDIELSSINTIEFYIRKLDGISSMGLSKFDEYDILTKAYQEFEKIFSYHHMNDMNDKVYYERTKLYHKSHWEEAKIAWSSKDVGQMIKSISFSALHLFFNKYCGHGVFTLKPICISLVAVIIFSLIFCGLNLIDYATQSVDHTVGWLQSFYFSVVTFTTLGFGDIVPINCIGQFLVAIEVMLGYLMLYTLVAILFRKFTR